MKRRVYGATYLSNIISNFPGGTRSNFLGIKKDLEKNVPQYLQEQQIGFSKRVFSNFHLKNISDFHGELTPPKKLFCRITSLMLVVN